MSAIEQAARAYVAAVRAYDPDWRSASAATITDAHDALCAAVDAQPDLEGWPMTHPPRTPSWHWDATTTTLHLWDAGDQPDDAQTLTGDTARRTVESLSWCVSEAIIRRPEPRAEAVCDLPMLDLGDGATTHPTCTTADPWSAS